MRIGKWLIIATAPSREHQDGLMVLASTTGLIHMPHTRYAVGLVHDWDPAPNHLCGIKIFTDRDCRSEAVEHFADQAAPIGEKVLT